MMILGVINNNVVSASDESGREVVAMGTGIGYKAKPGQNVPSKRIQKVFRMDSESSNQKFLQLLASIPPEHFQLTAEIIDYFKKVVEKELNKNIYITLTDHISFAIERYHRGMNFQNPLLFEVRAFYKKEFEAGKYALKIIEERMGIKLPEDEAASIALHIVNAEYNAQINDMGNITKTIGKILNIVSDCFHISLDRDSLDFERFITHLKFFVLRMYRNEQMKPDDANFDQIIEKQYGSEYRCSRKIARFIKKEFHHEVQKEELIYLTVHIRRITRSGTL